VKNGDKHLIAFEYTSLRASLTTADTLWRHCWYGTLDLWTTSRAI